MPPIYIMTAITLMASLVLWGGLIYSFSGRQKRYFWLLIPALPLSAAGNLLLRPKLLLLVGGAAGIPPGLGIMPPAWFLGFMVLAGPLIEEGLKVLPLLLPPVKRMVNDRSSAFWIGFALGVSFGLGEAVFAGYSIGGTSRYDSLPWYAFTGFMSERIMACFAHGVMTAVLISGIQRGYRSGFYCYFGAMGLHVLLNMPAAMYQFGLISAEVYGLSTAIPIIMLAVIFERMRRASRNAFSQQEEIVYWQRPGTEQGQ